MLPVISSCSSTPERSCSTDPNALPEDLACATLYSDFDARVVAKSARPFAPGTPFYSDGYDKARWIELPDGQSIDATIPDDWKFPVGTKLWKEFRVGDRKIETRLLWKKAEGWVIAAYVWSEDGTSAKRGEGSNFSVNGLAYHGPSQTECLDCHKGRRDIVLGFEAVSLAQPAASGITLAMLAQENKITPPPAKTSLTVDPGLAQLHVSCGVSCHNANSAATRKDSKLRLRISLDEAANKPVTAWELYTTTVKVPATLPVWRAGPLIEPGVPEKSVLISAMTETASTDRMPPTRRDVDLDGIAAVTAFIKTLPPR